MRQGSCATSWLGACVVLIGLGTWSPAARANGNYSHVWVAGDSLRYLPDGDLRDLLSRPDLKEILRNGAMYPDGGYAVEDGYGETSHWEPFHLTYLQWIRDHFTPPWSQEAAEHIAFLMGMATHGMTDQLYDGMFLQRHRHYDENGDSATPYGVDGSSDVCFAATQPPMEAPAQWVPADALAPLYAVLDGHSVDPDTIRLGHSLVQFAIVHATTEAADPAIVANYRKIYPWACGNQDNPEAPGSPPTCGPAVANYWKVLWGMLQGGTAFDQPLLGTFFTGGTSWDVPRDASNPDSWVSFAAPRGLDPSTLNADTVVVRDEGGTVHPVIINVFYRSASHLVNLKPVEDWAADAAYTVTVSGPVKTWNGVPLATTWTFGFSTRPQPVVPAEEVAEAVEAVEAVEAMEEAVEVIESVEPASEPIEDVAVPVDPGPDVIAPAEVVEGAADAAEVGGGDTVPDAGRGGGSGCSTRLPGGAPPFAVVLLGLLAFAAIRPGRARGPRRVLD